MGWASNMGGASIRGGRVPTVEITSDNIAKR